MKRFVLTHFVLFLMALPFSALPFSSVAGDEPIRTNDRQSWPRFRGPLATGVAPSAKPPTEWSEDRNIRWKYDIPGEGSSTPIVWQDRVYITSAIKTDRVDESITPPEQQPKNGFFDIKYPNHFYQFLVICVDRRSGKELWRQTAIETVPNEGRHPDNNFASATPTTDGRNLYVSFGSQGFYCYSLDGELKWKRDLGEVKTRNNFGEGASLTCADGMLVIVRDNETASAITVVDTETGETIWQKERDEPSCWATPIVVPDGDRKQLITNGHTLVRSYDLKTGELIWSCGGQVMNVTPCPVVFKDQVICMSGYRGNVAMAIDIHSEGDVSDSAQVKWKHKQDTPYIPSPILYDGRVYFTKSNGNILTCLDAATGKVVFDRQRLPGINSIYSSPAGADGKIYFVGRDGTTVVIRSNADFEVIATNQLDDRIDASPVLVDEEIFLRGRDRLYCIAEEK